MSLAAQLVDELYASEIADDAVWTPADGGAPATVRIFPNEAEQAVDLGGLAGFTRNVASRTLRVRVSEVASPEKGDQASVLDSSGAVTEILTVQGAPSRFGNHRLEWLVELSGPEG
jgi:hypothetical protein